MRRTRVHGLLVLPLAAIAAAQEPSADPFLERARQAVADLGKSLPNYAVRQETVRAVQIGRQPAWLTRDHVTAELLYKDGDEAIHEVKLNGIPAKATEVLASGAWSSGQFAGLLEGIFRPGSQAAFVKRGAGKVHDRAVWMYDYSVEQERSVWQLTHAGISHMAAFEGRVWLDQETARTLRFVMRSRQLPRDFPLERGETSTEYKMVRIGSGEFLLPSSSEAIICARGITPRGGRYCAQNRIAFKNYRQFGAESSIAFQ